MSVCTQHLDERADLPVDTDRFCAQIFNEWAGENRERHRQVAVLTLSANGWTSRQIGMAFGLGGSRVRQLIAQARESLRGTFVPPSPRDVAESRRTDGFSNPARPE